MSKFTKVLQLFFLIGLPCLSQQRPAAEMLDPVVIIPSENWAIRVKEIGSPALLADENSSKDMVPASLVKAITAAEGFRFLGKEFKFNTILAFSGTISPTNGKLAGDLLIIGSGDPSFGSARFDRQGDLKELVKILEKKGIQKINGDIIFVSGYFSPPYVSGDWKYADMGNYYAAGAYGLNYQDNRFEVVFQQAEVAGEPCDVIRIEPQPFGVEITSLVKAGEKGSGDQAYIHGAPFAKKLFIIGTIPPGTGEFRVKGALPDPAFQAISDLSRLLKNNKIEVSGDIKVNYSSKDYLKFVENQFDTLEIVFSPDLIELSSFMLKKSDNLIAECIGRSSEIQKTDPVVADHFGFRLRDKSGLSRSNKISAESMVRFLEAQVRQPYFKDFLSCFPVSSESGTLRGRFKDGKLKQKVYAKTGSMSGVRALAGYIVNSGKATHAFCYMINTDDYGQSLELQRRLDQYLESLDLVH
jgi:serine-type D-Ala-D-Ala carboxypeptidase/endopeptidase (penicillin-binding protein 4)